MNLPSKLFKVSSLLMIFTVFSLTLVSCKDDDPDPDVEPSIAEQTVFMYCPWAGGGSIYSAVKENITDFEQAIIENKGLDGRNLVVFVSQNKNKSCLINITYKKNSCVRDTLKTYDFTTLDYTTTNGLSSIIKDVKQIAPAKAYSMIIGGHGMGWLPADKETAYKMSIIRKSIKAKQLTRYFGDPSDNEYMTDITTLADGISNAGIKMKYILFDDCYMSNIETAYALKDVTEYLIASPCEVMMEGFPYGVIGKALLYNNYQDICSGFYNYYAGNTYPYGTIGITDCSQVESMALIMKEINTMYPDGVSTLYDIQKLDGYSTTIFFDFGSYVDKLCEDETLKEQFNSQLEKLVPYKANTPYYFTSLMGGGTTIAIDAFSGLTCSDPSLNLSLDVVASKKKTAWYYATH